MPALYALSWVEKSGIVAYCHHEIFSKQFCGEFVD